MAPLFFSKPARQAAAMRYVGHTTGLLFDEARPNWDSSGPRPLRWSAWYPSRELSKPVAERFFQLGALQADATPAQGPHPVILMSHGTGGSAESLGWLARALAREGYVVIGAQHHGNTGLEAYCAEGFLCWWERSADLTALLDQLSAEGPLSGALNLGHVSALGFSLGGPTVMALVGARYDVAAFAAWKAATPEAPDGPREFPDLSAQSPALLRDSAPFRASMDTHSRNLTDPRVQRCIVLAHAPTGAAFTPESLAAITRPVSLITGGADTEAPFAHGTELLAQANPAFRHADLGPDVGHYTFLGLPVPGAASQAPELFADAPGLDRSQIHTACLEHVLGALAD